MGRENFKLLKQKEALLKILKLSDFREADYFYNEFQKLDQKSFIVFYIYHLSREDSIIFFYYLKILHNLELYPIFIFPKKLLLDFQKNLTNLKIQYLNSKCEFIYFSNSNNCFLIEDNLSKEKIVQNLSLLCNFFRINKLIWFEKEDGIFDESGKRINIIHLLGVQSHFFYDDKNHFIFEMCKEIIFLQENKKFNISITSVYNFIRELFTVSGRGTYICKGSNILSFYDIKKLDRKKIYILIEDAFNKKLKRKFRTKNFTMIFLEENYRGCALFIETKYGFYLSKFAVGIVARGEGIGKQIWQKIKQEKIAFFWRAKTNNLMNKKYIDECEGFQKKKDWFYFWFGVNGINILKAMKYMENLEIDFEN